MLEDIKILLGLTSDDKDELLEVLISQATSELKRLTNRDNVREFSDIIVQMVIYKYNRLGTEGLNSESYAGESYNYSNEYPESIMVAIRSITKLKILW